MVQTGIEAETVAAETEQLEESEESAEQADEGHEEPQTVPLGRFREVNESRKP